MGIDKHATQFNMCGQLFSVYFRMCVKRFEITSRPGPAVRLRLSLSALVIATRAHAGTSARHRATPRLNFTQLHQSDSRREAAETDVGRLKWPPLHAGALERTCLQFEPIQKTNANEFSFHTDRHHQFGTMSTARSE